MKTALAIRHVAFDGLDVWESDISHHLKINFLDSVSHKIALAFRTISHDLPKLPYLDNMSYRRAMSTA